MLLLNKSIEMSELKKQTITIFDDFYTIVSDEPENIFSQAIDYTNDLMSSISLQSKITDKKKVAVLSALQMAIQIQKFEERLAVLKSKEKDLIASVNQCLGSS
ncbi:TPA: hypothetical protein DIC20_04450 [Candidatus Dependentiae bacterium]|nr:MAG: hypothetical protein US03_C0004G0011 [candidate division TM6 bacterium GW2011_GWF2_36_131]KKQ03189.1 MAG: hypothetical protein US13_C0004G0011 [candidate division TM6 bacterium GW2011_GWE2_36_25]KKQ18547.1 MAG: hypothetical protein US32_C0025G0011 [candidate division TM6 bacterium GW2011_GWA2_36_9]HBR70381.1 hypothetical protein [Candidatus Dependentiae bacterium]HCU00926.1 hypothetical protein [Candidatus Dependentiae bacterium]